MSSGTPYSAYGQAQEILKESQGKTPRSIVPETGLGFKNNKNVSKYTKEQIDAARQLVQSYEESQKMNETLKLDLSTIDTNFNINYSPNSDTKSDKEKESKPTIETIDFIETALKRIEEFLDKIKSKAESTFRSFKARAKDYKDAISKASEAIDWQEKAKNAYMERANAVGLSEDWAKQVRNGNINIADVSDDALKQQIKDYQECIFMSFSIH